MKIPSFRPRHILTAAAAFTLALAGSALSAEKLKALIVDGQNNHDVWPKSTIIMKQYMEETGMFEVDIERTQYIWKSEREKDWLPIAGVGEDEAVKKPKPDPKFNPDFSKYDLVVSNFGNSAASWPENARKSFEKYMADGGGLVVVHAANNAWGDWPEFNKMIGLGGWGGRDEKTGPYVYINNDGKEVRDDSAGRCGHHGRRNEFVVTVRDEEHPITKGLPLTWKHSEDECYSQMRGPAENMTILATACDSKELQQAGRHEPMLMVINYGKGRVFNTTLGHDVPAFEGVGFIETFLRGAEWVATGKVTREVPKNFPSEKKSVVETFELKK